MNTDQLSSLLERFNFQAGVFYNGTLCGSASYGEESDQRGHIHLLRAGTMRVRLADGSAVQVVAPTLLYCPRPLRHRFEVDGCAVVELTCASVHVHGGVHNPITQATPGITMLGIADLPNATLLFDWLFAEAVGDAEGRKAVLNRLFELLIIQILRYLILHGKTETGLLAGLADARIALALQAIHTHPESPWTIASMAGVAGMSRARFAAHFRTILQVTPLDYLTGWRLTLAQQQLMAGQSMKHIVTTVGYESASALARAFRRKLGCSPGEWLAAQDVKNRVWHMVSPP